MADRGNFLPSARNPRVPTGNPRIEVHPGKDAIVRFDPSRTFECVDACSWCCEHGVLLYEPDVYALADRESLATSTTMVRGETFVARSPKDRDEHVAEDGHACFYLDAEGRCSLQRAHDWKPTRCSVFPLCVEPHGDALAVDVREDAETHCEGLGVSDRRLIDHLDAFLPPQLWELPDPSTRIEL